MTPQEIQKGKDIKNLKADLDYVMLHTDQLEMPEKVTAKEVQDFLAKAENTKKVQDYYASHSTEFSTEEGVHARHILVKFEESKPDTVSAAKTKAEGLLARLKKGEDFAKLAMENSDDPGSKIKGGDLGFFGRGKMVPEFEASAFGLAPNALSDLVKSHYGYHIIQALEKRAAAKTPIEGARETIARKLIAQDRSEAELAQIKDLLKKGEGSGIDKWLGEHKLKWENTGTFDLSATAVPKIGANDEVMKMAFGLSASAPYGHELVRQGTQAYILKYKKPSDLPADSAKSKVAKKKGGPTPPSDKEEAPDAMSARLAQDVFGHWIGGLRKVAKIERSRNPGQSQNEPPPDF